MEQAFANSPLMPIAMIALAVLACYMAFRAWRSSPEDDGYSPQNLRDAAHTTMSPAQVRWTRIIMWVLIAGGSVFLAWFLGS